MVKKPITCRFCNHPIKQTFTDLGMSPNANAYLHSDNLSAMEPFYPLHAFVCSSCFLVQLEEFQTPEEIFSEYAYFSSYSKSWLEHAKKYVEKINQRFKYDQNSLVVEIASNDGYLLKNFKELGIPVLGVEPAANVAEVAEKNGIPTVVKFFGVQTANELAKDKIKANLIIGNNVLAHVPDINDFVGGLKILLEPGGVITIEFPHLLKLINCNQFDTIYHEHFSYLSFYTVEKIFSKHGLQLFDVDELKSHGGSLRIYGCHKDERKNIDSVDKLRKKELDAGINNLECYKKFNEQVLETKRKLLEFLIREKRNGKSVIGYGAPAKGNTLLNYCGVRSDFLDYTVDISPHKRGHFLPGTHLPIYSPDKIKETKPDYILILPWNLQKEIMEQLIYIKEWGGQFVVAIPELTVIN